MEENKRTILAVVLSLVVLIGWSQLSEHMGWTSKPEVQAPVSGDQPIPVPQPSSAPAPAGQQDAAVVSAFTPTEGREVTVETPLYTAVFHSGGGTLRSFTLKHYKKTIAPDSPQQRLAGDSSFALAPMGLTVDGAASWVSTDWAFEGENLSLTGAQKGALSFTGMVNGIRVRRELTFDASTYLITETTRLDGSAVPRNVRLGFKVGSSEMQAASNYDETRVAWNEGNSIETNNKVDKLAAEGIEERGPFNWAGIMNNYFMAVVAPEQGGAVSLKARKQGDFWGVNLERSDIPMQPGSEASVTTYWWYGAKDRTLLDEAPANLSQAVDLGMFSIIAKPLLYALVFFHGYVGNWGVAIILLTFCIRLCFFPLSQKSYKSMEKMKKLQPMMQKLREKHGSDREALNREVMQLYKTYGANPASGCLPILVQLPVFFGLYQALLNSLELRHAAFIPHLPFTDMVWLADLSAADPLYISPILMGATMFLQQKMSPPVGEPLQQKIMMAMPIIFTVMFINFPSGLVIYWFFNNLLSIAQQWLIMRRSSS